MSGSLLHLALSPSEEHCPFCLWLPVQEPAASPGGRAFRTGVFAVSPHELQEGSLAAVPGIRIDHLDVQTPSKSPGQAWAPSVPASSVLPEKSIADQQPGSPPGASPVPGTPVTHSPTPRGRGFFSQRGSHPSLQRELSPSWGRHQRGPSGCRCAQRERGTLGTTRSPGGTGSPGTAEGDRGAAGLPGEPRMLRCKD